MVIPVIMVVVVMVIHGFSSHQSSAISHQPSLITRVVQKAYIAGPHTTYLLVYSVYTSISVHERILGATIATHAQYTT